HRRRGPRTSSSSGPVRPASRSPRAWPPPANRWSSWSGASRAAPAPTPGARRRRRWWRAPARRTWRARTSGLTIDFAAVMARKEAIVERWRAGVERRLAGAGERLQFVRGHGRFVGPRMVEANGDRYQAPQVVINVGARPALPDLPGLAEVGPLTSTSALALTSLPARLLIVGGGYVACELGQIFRRLGAEVTLVERSDRLLSREDPEISQSLAGVFRGEGIGLELGAQVTSVARAGAGIEVRLGDGRVLAGSHLLVATGRTPNTADLGCEAGNVA